jgi:hypothetical protein
MRDIGTQRSEGCWVSLRSVMSSGEDYEERVCFWKICSPMHSGAAMGETPSGVCHNNRTYTFPGVVLKDKDWAAGCEGGQWSVWCCKIPPKWHSVRVHTSSKEKWGNKKGREPPKDKDALLSPY